MQVAASSASTSGVTLTLQGFDGVYHEDAVQADFVIYDSSDVSQSITGMTPGSNGSYALDATLVPGTYTGGLLNQPYATTKYFETPTLAEFTVS